MCYCFARCLTLKRAAGDGFALAQRFRRVYGRAMTKLSGASRRIALGAALLAPLPAMGAPAPAATAQIIALPLNPVVPADKRSCTAKTATGLGYIQLQAGAGAKPAATDIVLVNYIGYLAASGQTFDQAMTAAMPVDGLIPGFTEGLGMMAKGSTYRFCVPATLGYGAAAQGPIPANSDLVFQVELLEFKTKAEVEAMRKAQGAPAAP